MQGLRLTVIVRLALLATVALWPALAPAQEAPPLPMPRPADRLPAEAAPAAEAGEPAVPEDDSIVVIDETAAPLPPPPTLPAGAPQTATQALAALATVPQKVTLTAQITEDGAVIANGLVWRVFAAQGDPSGNLPLTAKSEEATATFDLAPGEYVVHVAYGRAQASERLQVASGTSTKSIILDAGALRLNAAVTGDVGVPLDLLRFDIYAGPEEDNQALIAGNVAPNDVITLNAGTYHVVSRFGGVNAIVRADLRVEPGQLTDAKLYHKAAQVAFKLVVETGSEAIAAVEWTVKTADGTTVFTDLGAFPTTVLAEGDYVVFAKQGDNVFNREFQVQAGPLREIEVLTSVY